MRYFWKTKHGTAAIVPREGRWLAIWRGENLGSYATAQHACDDMVGDHTYSPSDMTDLSTVGLPEDIGDWELER